MKHIFNIGETVKTPKGKAEVLMILGPRSDRPTDENKYSVLYFADKYKDRRQEWRKESELKPIHTNEGKTMNKTELQEILKQHSKWLADSDTGKKADLSGANLSEANLSEADLSEANLRGADLSEADLRGANLRWANLRWADLIGADLRRANLSEAVIMLGNREITL